MAEMPGRPIGYLAVLRLDGGAYDPDSVEAAGVWATPEMAAADAAEPEQARRLGPGERWVVCAVVPLEGGQDG